MIGFDPDMDYLYDPQQSKPAGWCEKCRREVWTPGETRCIRCRRAKNG